MARIRSIKPEFFNSPAHKVCKDPWARLLFIAMWNWADDAGRGLANPRELAGFAFPHDEEITTADIRRMLGEIRRAFDVDFYVVGGRDYYAIPTWEKHQKIDKRSGAKHPAPDEAECASDLPVYPSSEDPAEDPPKAPRVFPESSALEIGTEEVGSKNSPPSADASEDEPDPFDEFWSHYPRKIEKQDARKAWRSALKKSTASELIDAVKAYPFGTDPQFVKHAATWLNKGCWADEPTNVRPINDTPDIPNIRRDIPPWEDFG